MVNDFLLYLLQTSIVFTGLYFCYCMFVGRLTFHKMNRWFLVMLPFFSLLLPLIDWNVIWPTGQNGLQLAFMQNVIFIDSVQLPLVEGVPVKRSEVSTDYSIYLLLAYLFGVFIRLVHFVATLRIFSRMREYSVKTYFRGIKVLWCDIDVPFSYFNTIYVPKKSLGKLNKMILEHEAGHIKLRHSFDLLVIELYHCCFWFNPLLYLYRKSVKSLHEFQADESVLRRSVRTSDYLQLLLDTVQEKNRHATLSYFNNPIIKKRIMMITKNRSKRIAMLKYLPLLGTIVGVSLGFSISTNTDLIPEDRFAVKAKVQLATPPSIFPLEDYDKERITSFFGQKVKQPKTGVILVHGGIDIRAAKGTPVLATANGMVLKADDENDWGNLVVLVHEDGYQTRYAHLDGFNVTKDGQVKKGAVIGYVGSTGISSGSHLHYEVQKDGQALDPMGFFNK